MATLSTKLQVEGVANFKSAMSQSKAAVKQYSAELKLAEAQYKATGNAEEYLAKKSEILKAQIEEQQKVVEAAEKALEQMTKNGVDPADKAFQQMKTNLTQAQTQLVNMQNDLRGVGDTANTAASETKSLSSELSGIGKNVSLSSIKSGIDSITGAAATAAKTMAALGRGVWDMAVESAQAVDDAATVAAQYGLDGTMGDMSGTEVYMRMKAVEGVTDIGADDLLSAADKMTKGAVNGAVAIADGWQYTLSGNRLQDLFGVVEQINDLYEQGVISDKDSVMEQIFGKSFRNINNLDFESYSQALEEATVINEEQTNSLLEFSNAVDDMTQKFETFKKTISAELGPAMTTIAEAFSGMLQKLIDWANSPEGQAAIAGLGDAIAGIITSITEDDFANVVNGATSAIQSLAGVFKWIKDNKDGVKTGLEVALGVFATLKVASGVLTLLQLINGIISLGGASAAASAVSGVAAAAAGAGAGAAGASATGATAAGAAGGTAAGAVTGLIYSAGKWVVAPIVAAEAASGGYFFQTAGDGIDLTGPGYYTGDDGVRYYWDGMQSHVADEYDSWSIDEDWLTGNASATAPQYESPQIPGETADFFSEYFESPEVTEDLEEGSQGIIETLVSGIESSDSENLLVMAGYFMAQAVVRGVMQGAAGAGGGGSFSSTYIENMNLNGTGNPGEMFRELQKTRFELNAGYGG